MPASLNSEIEKSLLVSAGDVLLVSGETRMTGAEVLKQVERLSLMLETNGCQPGEMLALRANSSLEFILALLACIKTELIVAPLSNELSASGYQEAITRLSPQIEWDLIEKGSVVRTGLAGSHSELESICPKGGFVRFTSGTTSESKGVLISSGRALERIRATSECFALSRGEVVCSLMDLPYHFIASVLSFILSGVKLVVPSANSFSSIVAELEREEINILYGAPFHYQCLVEFGRPLNCLKRAVSTSASLHPEVADKFHTIFGFPLFQSLGIIEVGLSVYGPAGGSSLGKAAPGYELKLFEEEENRGLLGIRGPGGFDAYLSPFMPAQKVLRDGWFVSGDVVELDSEVSLIGRASSAINVAGHKVYPESIEEFLLSYSEIQDCRVRGEAHEISGQCLVADLVYLGEIDFEEFCLNLRKECRKTLGRLLTPVKFSSVAQISKTETGKTSRYLSQAMSNELELAQSVDSFESNLSQSKLEAQSVASRPVR